MKTERMIESFMEMVQIDSVSRHEGAFHHYLIQTMKYLGLDCYEDASKDQTGLGGNNLIFTLKGNSPGTPLFFSAHTDTVEPGVGIEPHLDAGLITSKGHTILGADDKAGIAILIELIQHIQEHGIMHPTLEFVFTPGEEIGLIGANALDTTQLQARYGLVLDSDGPVGGLTVASPTLMTITSEIHGKSSHAGLEPEKGISAIQVLAEIISSMRLGRLNDVTTVNVGVIEGGTATNVVAEKASMKAEVRSLDHELCLFEIDAIQESINTITQKYGATHTTTTDVLSRGYRFSETMPFVALIHTSMASLGHLPRMVISGGGSDANVFNAKGKMAVNIAIGYEKIHTVEEYIPVKYMEAGVLVCLDIIERMRNFDEEL